MTSINTAHAWLLEEAEPSREWTEQLCQRCYSNLSQSRRVLLKDPCSPANWSVLGGPAQLGDGGKQGLESSCTGMLLGSCHVSLCF